MAEEGQETSMPRVPRLRWTMIFWMFVISAVSYLDRNNLSIAAGAIKLSFGLTDVQLGGVFSAFALGYALSQPFAGRIADALGPHRTIAFAIIWWGIFTTLTPLVPPSVPHALLLLIAVRLLLGVGESVIYPASNRLVSTWIPSSERGLANGLIFAGVGVGGGIAPPLITWIVTTFGWHWAFYVSALVGVAVGAVWLLVVRDEPSQHPNITAQERGYIAAGLPAHATHAVKPRWRDVIGDRQVITLTLSYFCFGYVAYIFFSWFFLYLSSVRGLNLKASALLATLPFIAMTVFSTLGGILSDRLATRYDDRVGRCLVAAGAMIAAGLFVGAATRVSDPVLASLVLAGGAGSLYVAQSAYWTLSAGIGGRASGAVSGVINMGAQLGGVVTASTTPIIAHAFGWTASFLVAAVLAFAGGLAWLLVDPTHRLSVRLP
jgi:ACS family glucarate transporter-like MFS transporter